MASILPCHHSNKKQALEEFKKSGSVDLSNLIDISELRKEQIRSINYKKKYIRTLSILILTILTVVIIIGVG